jgi:hypothetical protein
MGLLYQLLTVDECGGMMIVEGKIGQLGVKSVLPISHKCYSVTELEHQRQETGA